jgi:acyl-coenzyme A thioesterase PaaI-like protein
MKGRLPAYRDSFYCGTERPDGLGLTLTYHNHLVHCDLNVDKRFDGYRNVLHGGMIYGILDVMIWAAIFMETKKICMTRKTDAEFIKPVMCNTLHKAKAQYLYTEDRDFHASAWIETTKGEMCARVDALFREAKDLPLDEFIGRFDFTVADPAIKDHFYSILPDGGK